ncbi:alpha/beta fold hydrolase [Candidatus Pantoea formicae]|uniref:alpha/beta fold hydrolase n=1 Tax=Candidatus Pantoea formicae TaxID=2608355 RepID=UPI003ED9D2D4
MTESHDVYRELGALLEQAGLAEHALFLNWGYQDLAASPLNASESQRQLVLQLVGDTRINGRQVLDVGCGRGGAAALLLETFTPVSITGIDLSPGNIAFCRQRHPHPRLRFRVADACQLPQADASVDVVLNIESSGAYEQISHFWRETWRVLKPGGDFLYADLFTAESLNDVFHALTALGFEMSVQRSISREVLAARRQNSDRLVQRLVATQQKGLSDQQLRDYFALPNSAVFNAMESGRVEYYILRLHKPLHTSTVNTLPEELEVRLMQRAARLAAAVEGRTGATSADYFPLQAPSADAKINVFALPYAGGGASIYREWGRDAHWPSHWRFCALQLPGRENRIDEAGCSDMHELVASLAEQIAPYADRPWALVGCSLGCKVAYELARWFAKRQQSPRLLFLMACPAPHIPITHRLSQLDERRFAAEVERLGGTPKAVMRDEEMMRTVGKALRADCALAESYVATDLTPLPIPVVLVQAEDDALVSTEQIAAWRQHFSAPVSMMTVQGGHFFLRQHRAALEQRLVNAINPWLQSAEKKKWFPFALPEKAHSVICFHHAGGSAASWREWLEPARQAGLLFCPIELPGHGTRFAENCIGQLDKLLDELSALIAQVPHPVTLMGHSLGALIVFALAQRLPTEWINGVIVSARRPPQQATPLPWRHEMSDEALMAELGSLGGTPASVMAQPELLSLFLPVLRADFSLTERYMLDECVPHRTLPLMILGGESDKEVPINKLEAWRQWGNEKSEYHLLQGDHFFLHQHKMAVVARIKNWLAEMQGSSLKSRPEVEKIS